MAAPEETQPRPEDAEATAPASSPAEELVTEPLVAEPTSPAAEPTAQAVTIRRAPKYSVFLLFGVAFGLLAAAILTVVFPENEDFGPTQVFGYLAVWCGVIGLALGGLIAWLLDVALRRRSRIADAERLPRGDAGA